jgi:pimeloyl-ACP methyl ester carboxylesterase
VIQPLPHVEGVDHQDVIVRGLRLHVAFAGPATGAPVMLLHGWPQHWYEWRHLIGPLAAAGYRVAVPDLRGFGWSEYPPDDDFRKETLVDDLIALCAELGYRRISFVGHDWGCWVGWLLCLRQPDLVDRAVLLSARSPIPPEQLEPRALRRLPRLAYQLPIAAPLPRAAKLATFRRLPLGVPDLYLDLLGQPSAMRASTLLYRQFVARELGPLIAGRYRGQRVTVPIHFMIGERDLLFYEELVDEQVAHVDNYRGEVLRGVGHFIPEEAPDLLRDRVLEFLGHPQGSLTAPR